MLSLSKLKAIWSRYSITIVMVPSIIGLHYGWNLMQYNRSLVTVEEQIDLPPVTFAKYLWRELTGDSSRTDSPQHTPEQTSSQSTN